MWKILTICFLLALASCDSGTSSAREQTGRPAAEPATANRDSGSFVFLGIPETESSKEGPVGSIQGTNSRIPRVTAVRETTYQEYEEAKQAGRIFTEESYGDYVYYAIKEQRDVRFDNASAWVEVTERFKARKP